MPSPLFLLAAALLTSVAAEGCPGWCNAYSCALQTCTDCSVCSSVADGESCASWCNSWTCSAAHCSGCATCPTAPNLHYIDADGSGTYSLAELVAAGHRLGCECLLSSQCMLAESDNVTITTGYAGYEAGLAAFFARHDVDGDGSYSMAEADAHVAAMPNLVKISMAHCTSLDVELREPAHWAAQRSAARGRRMCNPVAGDCAGANGVELITGSQNMPVPIGF